MKKLLYLFISLTLFACSTDDDTNTLTISIDEVTPTTATIQWSVPTASDGQTIRYQIILNGAEIESDYASRSYTFTNLQYESNYTVAIYALDNSGNSTFAESSFITLRNPIGGDIILSNQTDIENFDYEEINSLTLVGEGVTDVSSLSILRSVRGDINISSTSLTSLQGLENIIDPNPPEFSNYPELNVRNNLLLENLDALSNYTGGVRKLIITNNPQLNSISNLQINDFMRELTLKDIPATNFSNFSTLEICDKIIIDNISPNILAGLNSLSIVNNSLEIKDIDIQNLNALSNINTLYTLKLTNIPNFNNLNGIGDDSFYFTYKITETPPTLNLNFLNDLNFNYTIEVVDSTLSNLSILSNLTTVFVLSISGNDNLQNLTGLENITNLTYLELVLNPQLVNLNGLNSLESVSSINIRFNTALVNFSGLESLISFGSLRLINNNSITSLDGPTNLNLNNQPSGLSFLIDYNPLLADYCSISNYISLNGIQYGEMGGLENYRITNNLYNPSLSQIQTPEGCSQ